MSILYIFYVIFFFFKKCMYFFINYGSIICRILVCSGVREWLIKFFKGEYKIIKIKIVIINWRGRVLIFLVFLFFVNYYEFLCVYFLKLSYDINDMVYMYFGFLCCVVFVGEDFLCIRNCWE